MTSPKAMRRMAGMPRGPCACVTGGGSSLPSRAGPGCRVIGVVGLHGRSMHCPGGCIHRQWPTHGPLTASGLTADALRKRMAAVASAAPSIAHDLTEIRRMCLLEVACENGDDAQQV